MAVPTMSPQPVDPLRPCPDGRYEDDVVVVVRRAPLRVADGERWVGRTAHFGVGRERGRLLVVHALDAARVDNDVAALLAGELFAPGWAAGAATFERLFTGVVLTTAADPLDAWEAFYRNSLRALATGPPVRGAGSAPHGTLAEFAPVYRHAEALVAEVGGRSLLDVGSCFGFLPLRVCGGAAGPVTSVHACDVSAGTVRLLGLVAGRLGQPLEAVACDAARVPLPDRSVDVVTALHLLEHVDPAHGERIVAEAVRLARRRVVVAVPDEDEPDPTYGHVRTLTAGDLAALGTGTAGAGWTARVHDHHGGWLVLDRTA